MTTYRNAFKKAIEEGKINKDMFPWEEEPGDSHGLNKAEEIDYTLPERLKQLPYPVLNEFQIISENIRSAAIQNSLNIIGITSPIPRQGTSTLTAMLSLIIAAGKRNRYAVTIQRDESNTGFPVLLIDAHVRNPKLHEMFQVKTRDGLFDLLNDNAELNNIIKETDIPELKLITIGNNYDHFVHSHFENFKYLLEGLKTQFEFIFLDIPPVLHYAEGIALSKLCDGVVLVVEAGETRWEVVQEAHRALQKSDINIIGSILNKRKFYIPKWFYAKL